MKYLSKKLVKNYLLISFLLILTITCNKDVIVIDDYDFELITNINESGYVLELEDLSIKIKQEKVITTNKYFFSYEITDGEGRFEKSDGTVIEENNSKEISREEIVKYFPTTVGTHEVKVSIHDLNDNTQEATFIYEVNYAEFYYDFTASSTEYPINTKKPTLTSFIREGSDEYSFSYVVSGGMGRLYNDDVLLNDIVFNTLPAGTVSLDYLPETIGEHTIHVVAKAEDGGIMERDLVINVTNVNFNVNATGTTSSINVGQNLEITLELVADDTEDITYQITHEYGDGVTGVLTTTSGEVMTPGVYTSILPGTYTYNFVGTDIGESEIIFKVKDSNDQIKEDNLNVEILSLSFGFYGSPEDSEVYINESTNLNFDLNPDTEGGVYTLSYEITDGEGTLTDASGVPIPVSTAIDITDDIPSFSFNYIVESLGDHELEFTAVNNSGEIGVVTVELTAVHFPVTFTVNSSPTMYLGQILPINYTVTPISDTDITYQMNYMLGGGSAILEKDGTEIDPGTYFDVETGGFVYNFIPSTEGTLELTFNLKDSNGQIIERTIAIVVNPNVFTFTSTAADETIDINEVGEINCILNPAYADDATFYMTYTKTGSDAVLKLDDTILSPGVEIEIPTGAFTLNHLPEEVGTTTYEFTVSNSLDDQEVESSVSITSEQLDFNLTITPSSTILLNDDNTFNFALVPDGDYTDVTYEMTYDVVNPEAGNFDDNVEGVPFDVTPVSFSMNYVPTTLGTHVINFTITDSNGNSKDYSETVDVVAQDFIWTVNQSNTDIITGNSDTINASLVVSGTTDSFMTAVPISYVLTYSIAGVGEILSGGVPLVSGSTIMPGNYVYAFTSDDDGASEIVFTITDSNGVAHSQTVNYSVNHTDFNLYCSGGENMYLGNSASFTTTVSQDTADPSVSYEARYSISGPGTGTVDGVTLGSWLPIALGNTNRLFTATGEGNVILETQVREVGGSELKTCTSEFEIENIGFVFDGSPQENTIYVNESTNLNFSITEDVTSGSVYEMMFVITSGSASIVNAGTPLSSSTYYPVNVGAYSWDFNASNVANNVAMTFSVRNTVTLEIQNIDFDINVLGNEPCEFAMNATASSSTAVVNDLIPVNFNIDETGVACDVSYQMMFETTGAGINSFVYDDITYEAGVYFNLLDDVTSLGFAGSYKGVTEGTHNVTFTIKNDNDIIIYHHDTENIEFTFNNFNIVCGGEGTFYIGETDIFTTTISQDYPDTDITYQVKYINILGSGNGDIKNIDTGTILAWDTWYDIELGTTTRTITGTNAGGINLNVEIKQTTGEVVVTKDCDEINFMVNDNNFELTVNYEHDESYEYDNNVDFKLTQIGPGSENYKMRFSYDGSVPGGGSTAFNYGISSYHIGDEFTVNLGISTGLLNHMQTGVHIIKWEIWQESDPTDIFEIVKSFEILEENCNYNFESVQFYNSSGYTYTPELITIDIDNSDADASCSTDYKMKYEIKKDGAFVSSTENMYIKYDGINRNTDDWFIINPTEFNTYFSTNIAGSYELIFTVRNTHADEEIQIQSDVTSIEDAVITVTSSPEVVSVELFDWATFPIIVEDYGGGGNYLTAKVQRVGGDYLNSELIIDTTSSTNFDTYYTVNNTGHFDIKLKPTKVGDAEYLVTVMDSSVCVCGGDPIVGSCEIILTSEAPEFTIDASLSDADGGAVEVWSDDSINLNVDILTSFSENLEYRYTYKLIDQDGYMVNENTVSGIYGAPPAGQIFPISVANTAGNLSVELVVNSYNEGSLVYTSDTFTENFISNDILFDFNNVEILRMNAEENVVAEVYGSVYMVDYYKNIAISPDDLSLGKYDLSHVEFTINWYKTNGNGDGHTLISSSETATYNETLNRFTFNTIGSGKKKYGSWDGKNAEHISVSSMKKWVYSASEIDVVMIRSLTYPIPYYPANMNVKIYDTDGNFVEKHFSNLSSGWTTYTAD